MGKSRRYLDQRNSELSTFIRLYIYGIHGYVTEVMFTAAWEFVVNTNWKFPGCSSVWSLFIYAVCGYGIERMFLRMEDRVHIVLRGLIYLVWTYSWEFTTGLVLSYFGACPWDYTIFDFNIVGLITLEYAPLWYVGTLIQEQMLTKNILKLHWRECHLVQDVGNSDNGHASNSPTEYEKSCVPPNASMARKHD